jgi:hypothetical protein
VPRSPPSAATAREARLESGSPRGPRPAVSGKFVGEVERGEKSIRLDNLAHLARALRVPLAAMLKGLKNRKGRPAGSGRGAAHQRVAVTRG